MEIRGVIWFRHIIDKLEEQHGVKTREVEELLEARPRFKRIASGHVAHEDLFSAMGRYLIVFFIYKISHEALIVSARTMTQKERRSYGKK